MLILEPNTKQSPHNHMGDSVALDTAAFASLQKADIAVSKIKEADTARFLQDYARVLPCALKHVSINASSDSPTEPEFEMPEVGHTVYGHKPVIRRSGVVAVKTQDPQQGNIADDETVLGYIDHSVTVPKTTTTGESVVDHRNNLPIVSLVAQSAPNGESSGETPVPEYAVWDETQTPHQYSPFQKGALLDGSDPEDGYYYITNHRETIEYVTDDSGGAPVTGKRSATTIVKATKYDYLVAQDFNCEPFFYFPGYHFVQQLHVEHGGDLLYETTGEYSWWTNQLTRLRGMKDEDAKLAHAYGLEQNVINSPFSGKEALRNYPSPGDVSQSNHTNGIEMAQRLSRVTDALYAPICHPFNSSNTALPMPNLFATSIKYKYSLRPMSDVLVNPGGADTRNPDRNFTYDMDDIYIRPKNQETNTEFSNEELQRRSLNNLPNNMTNIQNANDDKHLSSRLEIVVVTLSQEELKSLENSKMMIVGTQPQTVHHRVSNDGSNNGGRLVDVDFSDTPSGYIRNYFAVGRQDEAIKKNMRYDLRTFVDPVTQRGEPALFSIQYSYDKQKRTTHGVSSESTSSHLIRNLYERLPLEIPHQAIHLLTAGFKCAKANEVTGFSAAQKAKRINFSARVLTEAFTYTDAFTGESKNTDVWLSVFIEMFQLWMFSTGYVFRVFNNPSVSEVSA